MVSGGEGSTDHDFSCLVLFSLPTVFPQLWPAIWLLPRFQDYGNWPASGEIDVVESRGNAPSYAPGGRDSMASTLHWGPSWDSNRYDLTTKWTKLQAGQGTFADDFHVFGLVWVSKYKEGVLAKQAIKRKRCGCGLKSKSHQTQFTYPLSCPSILHYSAGAYPHSHIHRCR
jgi:hypothetical protein